MRNVGAKEFEAALCVPDSRQQHHLDDQVEGLTHQNPIDRLGDLHARGTERSRADRDPSPFVDCRLQLLDLFDRCRQVGVGEKDLVSFRGLHADCQRPAFAAILRQGLDADGVVVRGGGVHDATRSIGAAVVNQDQLVRRLFPVEVPLDQVDRPREPLFLVVAGDDHAEHGSGCYLGELRTLIAYAGRTAMRRIRHGWRVRRCSHSRPALRIHTGARGTRPVR